MYFLPQLFLKNVTEDSGQTVKNIFRKVPKLCVSSSVRYLGRYVLYITV